ncbi:MAG: hypothetical protein K2L70_06685 [Clostridia bacterium]|nr:hypothetical protein [Clostridia bacterium]
MRDENYDYFQKGLEKIKGRHTEEEFFEIYNMSKKEYEEYLKRIEKEGKSNLWFVHMVIAYHNSYPEKEKEWKEKWGY